MATIIRPDIDFHGLFRKLGHSLEEIRVRTVDNILSKLEHKLICDADLVNERHLFIRLLEWFNFSSCPKTEEVLALLNRLSQHSAAAEIIQDIGGIEFLTQLRENVEPSLRPIIDQILENAMKLPEIRVKLHAPECIYQRPLDASAGTHQSVTNINESARSQPMSVASSSCVPPMSSVSNADRLRCYDEPSPGYFVTPCQHEPVSQPSDIIETGSSSCFYMTVFPWLPLTPTDRHVLASTNTSLQSKDISLLISASEFLSDVVIQDFPAEVFLQRPSIIKSLLSLLSLPSDDDKVLATHAARTLTDLTRSLHARMKYYQDPVLYTPKIDFCSSTSTTFSPSGSSNQSVHSSDPRPTVIGWSDARHRGDGRDQDSPNSSDRTVSGASSVGLEPDVGSSPEETDIDESPSLQHQQMTLPRFCVLVTHTVLPLLRCERENVVVEVLQLLHHVLAVMLKVIMKDVWQDTADAARDVVEKLSDSFEVISGLLDYHHHGKTQDPNTSPAHLSLHRLTYVGISNYLVKLLRLVPTTLAYSILPERLIPSLATIVFDESLGQTYAQTRQSTLTFIQQLDPKIYENYCETVHVCLSFGQTCQFLTCSRESRSAGELVTMVEKSVCSLPYHLHLPLISEFIKLFSNWRTKSSTDPGVITRCWKILLIFLSHPNTNIRQHTYSVVSSIIQGSLNVNEASDPKSRTCVRVRFLFDSDAMYEIVAFGLADGENKIATLAGDIMLTLLQGQLLMTEALWQEFTNSLLKSLPILQSYSDSTTILGKRIRNQLDPVSTVDNLPLLEKLRGCLRLMFSCDVKVRTDALLQLSWFLSNESSSDKKIPVFADLDLTSLANVFVMEMPHVVDEDFTRSVFKDNSVKQVYEIFTSKPVDPGVKKSAVDQLAIMMQDPHLHAVFRRLGGLETMLEYIRQGVVKHTNAEQQNASLVLVPACVSTVRHLVHHDYTLRHNLAHDAEVYYCLLRVGLLFQKDKNTSYEVAHLLTLLLNDEVAKFDVGNNMGGKITLPAIIAKRYRLPFRATLHHETSPNMVAVPPEDNPLMTGPPLEMLRISWNLAWNSGMENLLNLLKTSKNFTDVEEQFSSNLQLSAIDKKILEVTALKWGLQQAIFSVSNATTHTSVSSSLQRLTMYLTIIQGTPYVDVVNGLEWFQAMERFLQVTPTSTADEGLLLGVLRFITMVLRQTNHCPEHILQWLGEKMYHASSPMIRLLNRSPAVEESEDVSEIAANIKRSLDKQLLHFIGTFSSRLPYQLSRRLNLHQMRGELCKRLILRLNVNDAPHFYNLASLEGTLQCLVHITARPGWSQECSDVDRSSLCSQVLGCLLEVVSAFHIGRGGTAMSFMGKGVTKSATLCLRHLAYEMAVSSDDKNWVKQWLYCSQRTDAVGEPGLNWMLTLWAYRDPEVRSAGLGIAVTLTSTETGRLMITANCKHIPGGIWGAAFSMLLDQSECSMVRQQAALLLVNLTSETMQSGTVDSGTPCWQGPVVVDSEYDVVLVGLTALVALLNHSHFYKEMLTLLSNFYPHTLVQPISITLEMQLLSTASSETTLSTSAASVNRTDRSQGSSRNPTFQSAPSEQVSGSSSQARHMSQSQQTPMTSVSSGTPRSGFDTTQEMEPILEYQSVTTPCLVSAVSHLLQNLAVLAPHDTFHSLRQEGFIPLLTSLLNPALLDECCKHITSGESAGPSELSFRDLVLMNDSIIGLLRVCVVYDTPTRLEILTDKEAMAALASLLLIQCEGHSDLIFESNKLWTSVLTFLTSLLQLQSSPALQSITAAFAKIWTNLSESLLKVLELTSGDTKELRLACLSFISLLCCEEARQSLKHTDHQTAARTLSSLFETPGVRASDEKDGVTRSSGSVICKALISCYDLVTLKNSEEPQTAEGTSIVNALKSLLLISQSAKETALEMGLVEISLEHVQKIHTQLNMETLQLTKTTGKKKDEPLVQELILTFDLLRNFMCQNEKVKMASYHSGLGNICHRLWAWCCLDPGLMTSVLSLLTTYTAHCPAACGSLAYTTLSSVPGGGSVKTLSSNSLVHCVIKLAGKELGRESALMSTVFGLLATLTLSSECRSILFKCNFLNDFSKLNPKRTKKSKQKNVLEVCWFELLTNLSFSVDGQQMLLKINGFVDLVLDFLDGGPPRCQEYAILILRNLCCHAGNKQKLLANEKLIPFLLQRLEEGGETTQAVAASALWALVYNNQKAKVVLKNANILVNLKEALRSVRNSGTKSHLMMKCAEDLRSTISLVAE
ncbi:rotatin-like [Gigantopelta aegis]|uniref:rotatin-like n=1 Tax=Gigantopelta aegis TaxID=1735272 RepID=UPI001B88D522|nr:rotatin-like [Gigantopelta aegis]